MRLCYLVTDTEQNTFSLFITTLRNKRGLWAAFYREGKSLPEDHTVGR